MAAFTLRNLSVLAYAQGFTLWHYRAPHKVADTCKPGFFQTAASMIETGDMMLVSAEDGGTVLFVTDSTGCRHNVREGSRGERCVVTPMAGMGGGAS